MCRVARHGVFMRYPTENKILCNFPTTVRLAIKNCRLIDLIKSYFLNSSVPVYHICSKSYSLPKPKLPHFAKYTVNIYLYIGSVVICASFTRTTHIVFIVLMFYTTKQVLEVIGNKKIALWWL